MTVQYNGLGAVPSRPASKNISSTASSAGLIQVTTSAAHNLMNGDRVQIVGHGVVATAVGKEANGIWTVVVTGATTFTLTGSTYVGNGGATGTVQSLNLAPTEPLLVDGVDALDGANIHAPVEGALDKLAYLSRRVGAYRLHYEFRQHIAQTPNVLASNGATVSGAWGLDNFGGTFGSAYLQVVSGDLIEILVTGTIIIAGVAQLIALRPSYELADYGVAFTGTTTPLATAASQMFSSTPPCCPVVLHATGVVSPTRGKKLKPSVDNYGVTGGNPTYGWYGDVNFVVRQWRAR